MRGRDPRAAVIHLDHGITPACAGKRRDRRPGKGGCPDHPRVRGEEPVSIERRITLAGSPPRARGRELGYHYGPRGLGITPACAGKSAWRGRIPPETRDHPRACGEEPGASELRHKFGGSPPRVRGRGSAKAYCPVFHGITPACAGKSIPHPCKALECRDHPRVCGEESSIGHRSNHIWGSPPRMRGRANGTNGTNLKIWITPAYAGKSHKCMQRLP